MINADTIIINLDRSTGHIIVTSAANDAQLERDVCEWFGGLAAAQLKQDSGKDIAFTTVPYTLWHEYERAVSIIRQCKFKPLHGIRFMDGWKIYVEAVEVAQSTIETRLAKAGARLRGYGWDEGGGYHIWFEFIEKLGITNGST